MTLLSGAVSGLIASEAMKGRATCPRCDAVIEHDGRSGASLSCKCGWRMRWSAYERSFRDPGLRAGRAESFFKAFVEDWPTARSTRERMLAVDRVIHAMHVDSQDAKWGRHALSCVIEAKEEDARQLLDRLAYGGTDRDRSEIRDRWRSVDPRTRRDR